MFIMNNKSINVMSVELYGTIIARFHRFVSNRQSECLILCVAVAASINFPFVMYG
jgi:hypothetical protein